MAGRAALLPTNTPIPPLGPTAPPLADLYATYQQADLRAFIGAIDNLFLIFAALCALTALGALLMRSGPSPAAPASPAPPTQAASRSPSADGQVVGEGNLTPPAATITADNGRTAPQPVDVKIDTGRRG
jgi:hypothetical protein